MNNSIKKFTVSKNSTIYNAIKKCLFDDEFRNQWRICDNPYGMGNTGNKIIPNNSLVLGSPAKVVREITKEESNYINI